MHLLNMLEFCQKWIGHVIRDLSRHIVPAKLVGVASEYTYLLAVRGVKTMIILIMQGVRRVEKWAKVDYVIFVYGQKS